MAITLATVCWSTVACAEGGQTEVNRTAAAAHAAATALPDAAELERVRAPVAVGSKASTMQEGWHHGTFLEVYVRGYQDSDGDGIGDLKGLTSRLDYIRKLGVRGIWLMPIMASQDHDHGYAVTDYRAIEPDYGTMADFTTFLKEAHARGIAVVLDYLINHSAAQHPLFRAARSAPEHPLRDWYVWKSEVPAGWTVYGKNPWHATRNGAYYAGFWSEMPDWNLRNPAVLAWHHDNLRFWLNLGVDGFRFDAVGNLVENGPLAWEGQSENHTIMRGIQSVVRTYDRRYMICEAPGDPSAFGQPDSCGASFAFGYNQRLIAAALGDPSSIERLSEYFLTEPSGMSPFASNHDSFAGNRLRDRMGGDGPESVARMKLAAATYLLQSPAPPFVYYGEEIGMAAGQGAGLAADHRLRTPMAWSTDSASAGFTTGTPFRSLAANHATHSVEAAERNPESLLHHYRALIALRESSPALRTGQYAEPLTDGWMMSFRRAATKDTVVLVYNYGANPGEITLGALPAGATLTPLHPPAPDAEPLLADEKGALTVALPPLSWGAWRLGR